MLRKILIISLFFIIISNGAAFAFDSNGEVIFRDTLYGTAIGTILGAAFYLSDQDNFAVKLSTGVLIGTIGGLAYGFIETSSLVEIRNEDIKIAFPTPIIEKNKHDTRYSASLLKANF